MLFQEEASLVIAIARIMADTHGTQEDDSTTHVFGLSGVMGAFRSGVSRLWRNFYVKF